MKRKLGSKIKEIRKLRNLTQEQLSELILIEPASLCAIENGRAFPSLVTLERLAKALEVEPVRFFEFHEEKTIDEKRSSIVENINKLSDNQIENLYDYLKIFIS